MIEQILAIALSCLGISAFLFVLWAFGPVGYCILLHNGVCHTLATKHGLPLYILRSMALPVLCLFFELRLLAMVFTIYTVVHLVLDVGCYLAVRYMGIQENV